MLNCFSHVRLVVTLWTVAQQAPLSMGWSRQEYWSRSPCPPPGDLLHPGVPPLSLGSFHLGSPIKPLFYFLLVKKQKAAQQRTIQQLIHKLLKAAGPPIRVHGVVCAIWK